MKQILYYQIVVESDEDAEEFERIIDKASCVVDYEFMNSFELCSEKAEEDVHD
jgi:hypothetical protein